VVTSWAGTSSPGCVELRGIDAVLDDEEIIDLVEGRAPAPPAMLETGRATLLAE
jgi:hypothetical protein